MDQADCFVLLDNVQYKKNELQNRNRIKGPQWLTVPMRFKFPDLITEVGVDISDLKNRNVHHRKKFATLPNVSNSFTVPGTR